MSMHAIVVGRQGSGKSYAVHAKPSVPVDTHDAGWWKRVEAFIEPSMTVGEHQALRRARFAALRAVDLHVPGLLLVVAADADWSAALGHAAVREAAADAVRAADPASAAVLRHGGHADAWEQLGADMDSAAAFIIRSDRLGLPTERPDA